MNAQPKNKWIDQLSRTSFVMKGLDGLLECITAIGLLILSRSSIERFAAFMSDHNWQHDSSDILANFLAGVARQVSMGPKTFFALYLFAHGAVKVFLVVCLLRRQLWAFPASIGLMTVLISCQVYRYLHTYSVALAVVTTLDTVMTTFILLDYRYSLRSQIPAQESSK